MEEDVAALRRVAQRLKVAHIAADKLDVEPRKMVEAAGGQVVVDAHVVAVAEQFADERGADEPGAAGDQSGRHWRGSLPGFGGVLGRFGRRRSGSAPAAWSYSQQGAPSNASSPWLLL